MRVLSFLITGLAAFAVALHSSDAKPIDVPPEVRAQMQRLARINELAPADRIKSEADARELVNDLLWSFGFEEKQFPWFARSDAAKIKELFAHAEFEAVNEPTKRIPEDRIASAWNRVMDELGEPAWSRITVADVHYIRNAIASLPLEFVQGNPSLHPALISLLPNGDLGPDCRPSEAAYVLWMLQMRMPENLEAVRAGIAKGDDPAQRRKQKSAPMRYQTRLQVSAQTPDPRTVEYEATMQRYYQTHNGKGFLKLLNETVNEMIGR